MKQAVVTLCVGETFRRMAEVSHPTMQVYADRIGAEFVVLGEAEAEGHISPHWVKLALGELLNRYDRIIYLDTDILVREDCPDLFAEVPFAKLGAFDESPYFGAGWVVETNPRNQSYQDILGRPRTFTRGREGSIAQTCAEYGINVDWDGRYFNTGVMVLSPLHKGLFTAPPTFENSSFFEQGWLNVQRLVKGVEVHGLDHRLNRMSCMDAITGEDRRDCHVLHYAGHPAPDAVPDIMRYDLERWAEATPDYKFKRRIWVDVQGGLGDQVAAEPAVRFLCDKVYPTDDIAITSHWPRIFAHLARDGVRVGAHGALSNTWDGAPWHPVTLPGPETPQWAMCSCMMTHLVDYTSMALLRRTLPLADKSIRLAVDVLNDVSEVVGVIGPRSFSELTLVHPAKHWETKTFPVEWWQELVDGLQEAGETVCLIGRENSSGDRGVLPVECRPGMVDTRNRLGLGGLFALIGQAWCLVDCDSAPTHIAGASDGWIILVPTCKHPDHIFPYRQGTTQYKTRAVYRDLLLDDYPNHPCVLGETSIEFLKHPWEKYLPEPREVVAAVLEAHEHDRRAADNAARPVRKRKHQGG